MALDERYIVASDIEQYFVDKDTGLPLSNGTITFYRDVARTTLKQVYQLSGFPPNYTYTSMGAQITLSAVGTVQNSGGDNEVIYYFPFDSDGNLDLYYIVVADQNGVVQFTREAWPNLTTQTSPTTDITPIPNQIANAQFSEVFINEGFTTTYNVTSATNQEFILGPDWTFVISGSGSVVVQRIPVAGNQKIITSPPYVLDVSLTGGISSCFLRQRFNFNSGLWASTMNQAIFLAGTFIARNQNPGMTSIQMFYIASNGGMPVKIVDGTFDNSTFTTLTGVTSAPVPPSNDINTGIAGYIDIYLSFAISSHTRVSSIQVVPTADQTGGNFLQYDLNSSNREEALMGDYFLPALKARPTPSLLVGWDFTMNPFQFGVTDPVTDPLSYICDQTIAGRTTGAISFTRAASTLGLQLTSTTTNNAFYIQQYLEGTIAKKILGSPLSVNLFAYSSSTSENVTVRVYLFRAPSTAIVPILPTPLGNIAADGTFTLTQAGWTTIPRGGLDTATAILAKVSTFDTIDLTNIDTQFTGWEVTDASQINDTDKFAIVVTFGYVDAATNIVINSISLTPGLVPCRPAPQTHDEVLRECQYYYEKTYERLTQAGTITTIGSRTYVQTTLGAVIVKAVFPRFWEVIYNVPKRVPITTAIYSPATGTVGQVSVILYDNTTVVFTEDAELTNWILIDNSTTGFTYNAISRSTPIAVGGGAPAFLGEEAVINYHWVADARLGIVT